MVWQNHANTFMVVGQNCFFFGHTEWIIFFFETIHIARSSMYEDKNIFFPPEKENQYIFTSRKLINFLHFQMKWDFFFQFNSIQKKKQQARTLQN